MVALVVMSTVVVLLLSLLVAGLLRSHADILRALHSLGAGVGDPATPNHPAAGQPLTISPPHMALPSERDSVTAPPIAGSTPTGDALGLSFTTGGDLTLLAFLSTGCSSCADLWSSLGDARSRGLPPGIRLVVVTKGPEHEIAADVAGRVPAGLDVLMSTDAWRDYEVPGSPFFVLVDGRVGRRIGEGVAHQMAQVVDLVRRAQLDAVGVDTARSGEPKSRSRAHAVGLNGPERESANDRELMAAGILPGDPSLYPRSLAEVFGTGDPGHSAGR